MSGKLSTHVLDNYHGKPATGIPVTLSIQNADGSWREIVSCETNKDGRTDAPLLKGDDLNTGRYRLLFKIADYYQQSGVSLSEPAFLDEIPIEVNLTAGGDYHVPLLMTPWSYSTYRGS